MKKNKILLSILAIIIVITVAVFLIIKHNIVEGEQGAKINGNIDSNTQYFKESEDNSKINISKELNKTKEFEGFKVSNIRLTEKEKEVVLLADVTNHSGKNTNKLTYFNITFLDNENKEIGTFPGVIDKVKQNETTTLNSSVKGDIANYINAYDFKLTIDKSR